MKIKNLRKYTVLALTALMVVGFGCLPVSAASKSDAKTKPATTSSSHPDISGAVTQSYNADPSVQVGMLVELKDKDPTTVVPLSYSDINKLLGAVIPSNNAAIVLTPAQAKQQQVLVTNGGHYDLLVSNQNGPVKVGDYITVSAIAGVSMRAGEEQPQVIGKAAGNFTGSANVIGTVDLKDTLGKKVTVTIGKIPVDIAVSHNPLSTKTADYVPSFLAKAATTVNGGKPVSAARIYLGGALLFVTTIITSNMLYSGVRSGMIAVGRNPLSKKSIIRSLIQTVLAGLIIFVAGVFAVYLLLKL